MSCVLRERSGGSAVQPQRDTALGEAGHAKIVPRSSLLCQDHPFCTKIGLGSCPIFITSPMGRKYAESIFKSETADKTHNLIISELLNIIKNNKFHQ